MYFVQHNRRIQYHCRKLNATCWRRFFLKIRINNRSAPAIYFTRVDAIIIGACWTIELISAAKALDRDVYRLTQMERAKETSFLDSHALLLDYLCVHRAARSKEEWEKVWRKIGRERTEEPRGKCTLESNLYT